MATPTSTNTRLNLYVPTTQQPPVSDNDPLIDGQEQTGPIIQGEWNTGLASENEAKAEESIVAFGPGEESSSSTSSSDSSCESEMNRAASAMSKTASQKPWTLPRANERRADQVSISDLTLGVCGVVCGLVLTGASAANFWLGSSVIMAANGEMSSDLKVSVSLLYVLGILGACAGVGCLAGGGIQIHNQHRTC
jgi:hypothetical protein